MNDDDIILNKEVSNALFKYVYECKKEDPTLSSEPIGLFNLSVDQVEDFIYEHIRPNHVNPYDEDVDDEDYRVYYQSIYKKYDNYVFEQFLITMETIIASDFFK